jgi:hypothetical protein
VLLSTCLGFAVGWAQPADGQTETGDASQLPQPVLAGVLRVRSEPPGALVVLEGDHTWRATTPWDLNRSLKGRYDVTAELSGYEPWRRTIHLVEGETRDLEIRLRQKQAWKAGLRSLLLPGWGQHYADQSGKGRLILLGGVAIAGALWWTHEDYQDRLGDFEDAKHAYSTASPDDRPELRSAAERSQRRAERAYDRRQLFLYAAGGLYAFAFIDSYFFFPRPSEGSFASLSPWGERGPSVALEGSPTGDIRLAVQLRGLQGGER